MKRNSFSHLDKLGNLKMVDVSNKKVTHRGARASAFVGVSPKTISFIQNRKLPKGDLFTVAKVAGILAAKRVDTLIPLTHSVPITACEITFCVQNQPRSGIEVAAIVKTQAPTGVEMEALAAVSVAALTLYDMVKSVERGATICDIRLEEKWGGKSGHYRRKNS